MYSLSHSVCGSGVQTQLSWILYFRIFCKAAVKWHPELGSYLKAQLEKDPFISSLWLLAEVSPSRGVWLRASVSHWQLTRGHPRFFGTSERSVNERGHLNLYYFDRNRFLESQAFLADFPSGLICQCWVMCPYLCCKRVWESKCEYVAFLPLAETSLCQQGKHVEDRCWGLAVEEAINVYHRHQLLRDRLFQGHVSVVPFRIMAEFSASFLWSPCLRHLFI